MKKSIAIVLGLGFLLLFGGGLSAGQAPGQAVPRSFGPGEELHYGMRYGFIRGGGGVLSVKDSVWNGQRVYHLVGSAHTSGLADRIFRVRDVYESFFNPYTQLPDRKSTRLNSSHVR